MIPFSFLHKGLLDTERYCQKRLSLCNLPGMGFYGKAWGTIFLPRSGLLEPFASPDSGQKAALSGEAMGYV
jgi:hypothetical protein